MRPWNTRILHTQADPIELFRQEALTVTNPIGCWENVATRLAQRFTNKNTTSSGSATIKSQFQALKLKPPSQRMLKAKQGG